MDVRRYEVTCECSERMKIFEHKNRRGSEWGGGGSTCQLSVKIQLLCR